MASAQCARSEFGALDDKTEVWFAVLAERRWYTQNDDIGFCEICFGCGGFEPVGIDEAGDEIIAKMLEVTLTGIEFVDFGLIDIEADDFVSGVVDGFDEREPDISEADDADACGAILKFRLDHIACIQRLFEFNF